MHDDPFDEALEGSEERFVSEKAEARQERWEERVIKRLVQAHVGATAAAPVIREMKYDISERTNRSSLTFDAFINAFPKFPLWIVSVPIPFAHNHVSMAELRTKKEHWFRRVYRESLAKVPEDWDEKPVGLLFEMLNSGGQFNLLHNHYTPTPSIELEGELRVIWPRRKGGIMLYLDTLDLYLHSIGWFGTGSKNYSGLTPMSTLIGWAAWQTNCGQSHRRCTSDTTRKSSSRRRWIRIAI